MESARPPEAPPGPSRGSSWLWLLSGLLLGWGSVGCGLLCCVVMLPAAQRPPWPWEAFPLEPLGSLHEALSRNNSSEILRHLIAKEADECRGNADWQPDPAGSLQDRPSEAFGGDARLGPEEMAGEGKASQEHPKRLEATVAHGLTLVVQQRPEEAALILADALDLQLFEHWRPAWDGGGENRMKTPEEIRKLRPADDDASFTQLLPLQWLWGCIGLKRALDVGLGYIEEALAVVDVCLDHANRVLVSLGQGSPLPWTDVTVQTFLALADELPAQGNDGQQGAVELLEQLRAFSLTRSPLDEESQFRLDLALAKALVARGSFYEASKVFEQLRFKDMHVRDALTAGLAISHSLTWADVEQKTARCFAALRFFEYVIGKMPTNQAALLHGGLLAIFSEQGSGEAAQRALGTSGTAARTWLDRASLVGGTGSEALLASLLHRMKVGDRSKERINAREVLLELAGSLPMHTEAQLLCYLLIFCEMVEAHGITSVLPYGSAALDHCTVLELDWTLKPWAVLVCWELRLLLAEALLGSEDYEGVLAVIGSDHRQAEPRREELHNASTASISPSSLPTWFFDAALAHLDIREGSEMALRARKLRSGAFMGKADYKGAIKELQSALDEAPDDGEIYALLAHALNRQRDLLNPSAAGSARRRPTLFSMGSFVRTGHTEEALQDEDHGNGAPGVSGGRKSGWVQLGGDKLDQAPQPTAPSLPRRDEVAEVHVATPESEAANHAPLVDARLRRDEVLPITEEADHAKQAKRTEDTKHLEDVENRQDAENLEDVEHLADVEDVEDAEHLKDAEHQDTPADAEMKPSDGEAQEIEEGEVLTQSGAIEVDGEEDREERADPWAILQGVEGLPGFSSLLSDSLEIQVGQVERGEGLAAEGVASAEARQQAASYVNLGNAFGARADWKRATIQFNKAIAADPMNYQGYVGLSETLRQEAQRIPSQSSREYFDVSRRRSISLLNAIAAWMLLGDDKPQVAQVLFSEIQKCIEDSVMSCVASAECGASPSSTSLSENERELLQIALNADRLRRLGPASIGLREGSCVLSTTARLFGAHGSLASSSDSDLGEVVHPVPFLRCLAVVLSDQAEAGGAPPEQLRREISSTELEILQRCGGPPEGISDLSLVVPSVEGKVSDQSVIPESASQTEHEDARDSGTAPVGETRSTVGTSGAGNLRRGVDEASSHSFTAGENKATKSQLEEAAAHLRSSQGADATAAGNGYYQPRRAPANEAGMNARTNAENLNGASSNALKGAQDGDGRWKEGTTGKAPESFGQGKRVRFMSAEERAKQWQRDVQDVQQSG